MPGASTSVAGRLKSSLLWPGAFLLRGLFRILGASYRYDLLHRERIEDLLASPRPVVVSLWHDQIFAAGWFLYHDLHCRGLDLALVASHSRDGELVTRFARPWKLRVVRGSSSQGGREALMGMYRAISKHGASPLVIPDGPRGPRHVCSAGALLLSQLAQVPILPLVFVPERAWHLRSWDRMAVPRFGSRVAVAVGELQQMPRRLATGELEAQRRRMESLLQTLAAEAQETLAPSLRK